MNNTINNPIEQFKNAIRDFGLEPPAIIEPGKFYRFPGIEKGNNNTAGWCKLFDDGRGGCFGDWSNGITETWQIDENTSFSLRERVAFMRKVSSTKAQAEKERKEKHAEIAKKAVSIWSDAKPASNGHQYLIHKRIKDHGARVHNSALLIPLCLNDEISSLQFINTDGKKNFLSGGRVSGCYFNIGDIKDAKIICIAEGFATGATIHEATGNPVVIAFNAGNLKAVAMIMREKFSKASLIFCADDDVETKGNPGLTSAKEAAKIMNGLLAVPNFGENRPDWAKDFNDLAQLKGLDAVSKCIKEASPIIVSGLKPLPMPDSTPGVMSLHPEMLPVEIRDYVFDVADRQQCPPDFGAVATIVGLSGLLGRKALICPKQNDNWAVTPNQWGVIIGRPSAMKSPSMKEALKPLYKIEQAAAECYEENKRRFTADQTLMELEKTDIKSQAKKMAAAGNRESALLLLESADLNGLPPTRHRLVVNDSSVEKLGELLNENPNGLLLVRDELSGWLAKLSKEEFQPERAFYLECFDGNGRYVYDRIGRGTIEINCCTLSVIGGIQPSKIATLVRDAIRGIADDGLIQRFQLAVWPDDTGSWEWRDQVPNKIAKESYYDVFEKLHNLAFEIENDEPHCFRFTFQAQELFIQWMEKIQAAAREEDIHPALESHILKMPQTIASLALLFEIIDGGYDAVGIDATAMALKWADYLLSHARRLYSIATNQCINNARLILERKSKLPDSFTVRDIHRKNWSGLDNINTIADALDCLIDYHYLMPIQVPSTNLGGRPTLTYKWNL